MATEVRVAETDGRIDTEELVDLLQQALEKFLPSLAELTEDWCDVNVTLQQLRVMTIIYMKGQPQRVSTLANRLKVSRPTMTGILERLVIQGLIIRQDYPDDRRVVLNALTEQGQRLIERLQPIQRDRLRAIITKQKPNDQQKVVEAFQLLLSSTKDCKNS